MIAFKTINVFSYLMQESVCQIGSTVSECYRPSPFLSTFPPIFLSALFLYGQAWEEGSHLLILRSRQYEIHLSTELSGDKNLAQLINDHTNFSLELETVVAGLRIRDSLWWGELCSALFSRAERGK